MAAAQRSGGDALDPQTVQIDQERALGGAQQHRVRAGRQDPVDGAGACAHIQRLEPALVHQIDSGILGADPKTVARIHPQTEDAVAGRPFARAAAKHVEGIPVEAHQPAERREPEITGTILHDGADAVLRQPVLAGEAPQHIRTRERNHGVRRARRRPGKQDQEQKRPHQTREHARYRRGRLPHPRACHRFQGSLQR